jgi:hypothetical protein
VNAVWIALGAVLVAVTLSDAADTLVSTRLRSGRWWPTEVFYRTTWTVWLAVGQRFRPGRRREQFLSLFGPLSLLVLLALWTATAIVGWSLVWWGLRGSFVDPPTHWVDSLYYSGVVYFSVGFGDVLPATGAVRVLSLVEAFGGLGLLGLVIGFLPSLYAAYQQRESQLAMLDDLTDSRIVAVSLAVSRMEGGDTRRLDAFFEEWERWCADVLETHMTFPMLTLFRSQRPGQSWVTALGVVADAAAGYVGAVPGTDKSAARFMHRRAALTLRTISERIGVEPDPTPRITGDMWRYGYDRLQGLGIELRPFEETWVRVEALRAEHAPWMEGLIDALDAPRGFWGHTPDGELREPPDGGGAVAPRGPDGGGAVAPGKRDGGGAG